MKKKGIVTIIILVVVCVLLSIGWIIFMSQFLEVDDQKEYQSGYFYDTSEVCASLQGVKASTDIFPVDNVTLELYYGLYNQAYEPYDAVYTHFDGEEVLFAIYVCDGSEKLSIIYPMKIDDYKTIENHTYLKGISYEEAFTSEYGYTVNEDGVHYNHQEMITIPEMVFSEKKGKILIKICSFNPDENGETYSTAESPSVIDLDYEMIDENTVRIIFD